MKEREREKERAHTVSKNVNTSSVSKHCAIEFVALNRQFVGVSCTLSKTVIRLKINHLHRIINDIHDKKLENPTEYYAVILLLCKFECLRCCCYFVQPVILIAVNFHRKLNLSWWRIIRLLFITDHINKCSKRQIKCVI